MHILPRYISLVVCEGKCQAMLISQLGYEEETGNSYQWQVHLLMKQDHVTVTKLPILGDWMGGCRSWSGHRC
jgi:hypothetical protein